ncbi:MAG: M42 family metallopeptidase [Clostridiales bacterium]|nr:M42 family metallopeptidase [Clostridiales bacterium]
MKYLKELVKLRGVSGDEKEVRKYIFEECKKLCSDVRIDKLGSIIAIKKGTSMPEKLVMCCAHMDEIGFIITAIEKSGTLKFTSVGGMDPRVLVSKRVLVGEKRLPGVIGIKAIHLLSREEMQIPPKIEQLYIDIGAVDDIDAKKYVEKGDTCIFAGEMIQFGDNLVKSRALDDRVGCAILLNTLENNYPVTVAAVFSVQEEVGTRGARVTSYALNPDCAFVLEGTTCADMHGVPEHLTVTQVGKGTAISIMDRSAIPNRPLREFITSTADKNNIKWQYRAQTIGGTDAGAIQLAREGLPVVQIAAPCRYIHSPVSVVSKNDFKAAKALLKAALNNMKDFFSIQYDGGQNDN